MNQDNEYDSFENEDLIDHDKIVDDYYRPQKFLEKFYDRHRNNSVVLSKEEIFKKYDKLFSFSPYSFHNETLRIEMSHGKDNSSIIFGLKSGIYFRKFLGSPIVFLVQNDLNKNFDLTLDELSDEKVFSFHGWGMVKCSKYRFTYYKHCLKEEKDILLTLIKEWKEELVTERLKIEKLEKEETLKKEERLSKLKLSYTSIILELDKDKDGAVDIIDCSDFNKLLQKNQKEIIQIDKSYIQKFVKIYNYLNEKKSNIQLIFNSIKTKESIDFRGKISIVPLDEDELNEKIDLLKSLKNQIHTYDLLIFHCISMITSLVDGNLIVFYEIYECIDKLGIFNSNWENEVSNKLSNIEENLNDLVYSINKMENNIVSSVKKLTYITQESFKDLNFSVNKQLNSIDSTMKFNNLLTLVQTYEVYKINENTKRLD